MRRHRWPYGRGPGVGPVQVEDELGDGVDDRSGLVVAGISVDVAADGQPGGDAIEVAEGVLEAGQDGEGGQK